MTYSFYYAVMLGLTAEASEVELSFSCREMILFQSRTREKGAQESRRSIRLGNCGETRGDSSALVKEDSAI
jgi:hypothetical protein